MARNREPKLLTQQIVLKEKIMSATEVEQLNEALKSGDLASAQQDYKNLVALGKNGLQRDNPFLRSDRGQDFNAIGGALQNGDLKPASFRRAPGYL
jgi:hypothetical protein